MKATTLTGHSNPIYTVITHPTENLCYSAGNDKGIVEWNLETKTHQRVFNQIKETVYSLEIIIELNLLIAGSNDGTLCFFDLASTKLLANLNLGSAIFDLAYIDSKKELIASTDKGFIFIINPNEKIIIHQFQSGSQKVRSFAFHQQQNLFATVSNDENIRIYNLEDYGFNHEFKGHDLGIGSVAFSPDGKHLVTGGRDAHLKVWNTVNWDCEQNFAAHLFAIYQIVFHPNLPYFATASRDKSIKIWRTEDYSLSKNLSIEKSREGHRLSVNDICWSYDGKQLLSVSDDKMLKVWDFEVDKKI
jgi:centriolar protein POC1